MKYVVISSMSITRGIGRTVRVYTNVGKRTSRYNKKSNIRKFRHK